MSQTILSKSTPWRSSYPQARSSAAGRLKSLFLGVTVVRFHGASLNQIQTADYFSCTCNVANAWNRNFYFESFLPFGTFWILFLICWNPFFVSRMRIPFVSICETIIINQIYPDSKFRYWPRESLLFKFCEKKIPF